MSTVVTPYSGYNDYDTTESRWFKIIVLIVAVIILIFAVINIIYYNRIRDGQTVSSSEASVLLWLNVAVLIVTVFIVCWALWRIIFSREYRRQLGTNTQQYLRGYGTGLVQPTVQPTVVAPGTVQPTTVLVSTSGAESQNVLAANVAQQIAGAQG